MKQVLYIVAVIVLMYFANKVMSKVKDDVPEEKNIPDMIEEEDIVEIKAPDQEEK